MKTQLIMALSLLAGVAQAQDDTVHPGSPVHEVIDHLMTVTFSRVAPPELQVLLDDLAARPMLYVNELAERVDLEREIAGERLAPERLAELRRALSLLPLLGDDVGAEPLARFYAAATEVHDVARERYDAALAADDDEVTVHYYWIVGDWVSLRRTALKRMAALGSSALTSACLDTIAREDYTLQLVMLRYLGAVAKGDPYVFERLRAMSENPHGPLFGDPALAHAIAELR